jgi:hypothetical protein
LPAGRGQILNEHTPPGPAVEVNQRAPDVLLRRMRTESDFSAL